MAVHFRANLLLLGLTVVIGAILYPLVVLGFGQGLFPNRAAGSFIIDRNGNHVGSRFIAQDFQGDEWFQPRPSAASYNAAASGASNWGANNPKLRDRVARQLGSSVRYRPGARSATVQQDIESWFVARSDRLTEWVKAYPTSASNWLTESGNVKAVEAWTAANGGVFFETFAAKHPGTFPTVVNDVIRPATSGASIHSNFFEMWLRKNPDRARDIEPVAADAVTASGSGLDPHITVMNAKSQIDRVVASWARKTKLAPNQVGETVEAVLNSMAFDALGGIAGGERLVNVLEVNIELARRFE